MLGKENRRKLHIEAGGLTDRMKIDDEIDNDSEN